MSRCVMHLALVAQCFPEMAENFLAAPFEISPVRDYSFPRTVPGKRAPSESRSAERNVWCAPGTPHGCCYQHVCINGALRD